MNKSKYFIITVDTEGDNLWGYKEGNPIGTRNADYIPRFQSLCDRYGFKPVYLTSYEMAMSNVFVKMGKEWLANDKCEIGVHLHAWNNPPYYKIDGAYSGNPYLIEYPEEIMRKKFQVIYDLIIERFGIIPISHRAGRWAMNDTYFKILKDFGIKVDCSYTPYINWQNVKGISMGGSDYSLVGRNVSVVNGVKEVPMSVMHTHKPYSDGLRHKIKTIIRGNTIWLRPACSDVRMMKAVIDFYAKDKTLNFVEFMIHSSELMPGGSPYFQTTESIENEFRSIEKIFEYAIMKGYKGCTLKEYIDIVQ